MWPVQFAGHLSFKVKKTFFGIFAVVLLSVSAKTIAQAQEEPPFIGGDFWQVAGVKAGDGGSLKYARWLADEPDLCLISVFENMATVAEGEERRIAATHEIPQLVLYPVRK